MLACLLERGLPRDIDGGERLLSFALDLFYGCEGRAAIINLGRNSFGVVDRFDSTHGGVKKKNCIIEYCISIISQKHREYYGTICLDISSGYCSRSWNDRASISLPFICSVLCAFTASLIAHEKKKKEPS